MTTNPMTAHLEVRLRVLTVDDAAWIVSTDARTTTAWAAPVGFERHQLADALAAGQWASEDRWGWAIMVNGTPAGFALVTDMASGDGSIQIRLRSSQRGRGVGREVLRKLADHHFADNDHLQRLVGVAHERNLAMQRAFNAAGFRMDARRSGSATDALGAPAATWDYALTRRAWELRRHRMDDEGYDLHGLSFAVDEVLDGPTVGSHGLTFRFMQDGSRVTAAFQSQLVSDGELAGIMRDDVVHYHYVQAFDPDMDGAPIPGRGRLRIQRIADDRLQLINEWMDDDGRTGRTVLVQASQPVDGAARWVPGPATAVVTWSDGGGGDESDEPILDDAAARAS